MKPHAVCVTPQAAACSLVAEAKRVLPETLFTICDDDPVTRFPDLPPHQLLRFDCYRNGIVTAISPSERSDPHRPEAYLACGVNCPGRCTYCVLKECVSVSYPTFYANVEDMAAALDAHLTVHADLHLHLGHVLDPLAYPFLRPLLHAFVDVVRAYPRTTLEIRTKFAAPDLLPADPPPNVVLAFSFAPRRLVKLYERGTAGLSARLRAGREAARRGYRLGIRLDPVFFYAGWELDYGGLIAELLAGLPAEQIADVVLGCFRGPEALIRHVKENDPAGLLRRGEFVRIGPGKFGYPRPQRLQALRFLGTRLGGRHPIRFCFEDHTSADAVFGRPGRSTTCSR